MFKYILVFVLTSAISAAALANDAARAEAKQVFNLKDGSTLYIFKDGKMAMEDHYGRATKMKPDTVMETREGQKIMMHGGYSTNAVASTAPTAVRAPVRT